MKISSQVLEEILTLCSIILVYLEIQFSKFRDTQKLRQQKPKEASSLLNEKLENENLQLLIYKLSKLEYALEQNAHYSNEQQNISQDLMKACASFSIRAACLGLFASFNEDSISPDYYIKRINDHLETTQNVTIIVANSKIVQAINKESIKDFLKMNKKNQIYKLNDRIEKLFTEKNYEEVINQLEEFAENHQISFEDMNLKTLIYSRLLHSYFKLNIVDKCGYFCRKFLRQTITYLNEQNNLTLSTASSTATTIEKSSELITLENENVDDFTCPKNKKLKEVFDFISDMLDLIHK